MTVRTSSITPDQAMQILSRDEGQFCDFKAKEIAPAKLSKTISAFANADGGEIFVGISDPRNSKPQWVGFEREEDANSHLQIIDNLFPIGSMTRCEFLKSTGHHGFILHIEVDKTPDIRTASDGVPYLRRGSQSLPQDTSDKLERLKLDKGIKSYEDQTLNADASDISNSSAIIEFMLETIPSAEPDAWLKKQKLIVCEKPTVAGVMLFSDEPQIDLPKASIKIYRYKTTETVGTRATLAFDPISIDGNSYLQIFSAVAKVRELTEKIPIHATSGLEFTSYPTDAIHEIITNAVIHRDYSINDDIHVRIFDNRIEVQSPGVLPGHVTVANILDERAARNPKIVRLLNKFKNPPNKDVGEGLNTAFEAMRGLKLKDPTITQLSSGVLVVLRHEKLGTPEQIITEYLKHNDEINNSIARSLCFIGSENTMKRIFQRMIVSGLIERIPGRSLNKTGYAKGGNFPSK